MLVCGDVFEHLAPSPDAEQVVYEALLEFEAHAIPVVLHRWKPRSAQRWHAVEPLLERFASTSFRRSAAPSGAGSSRSQHGTAQPWHRSRRLPWVPERRLVGASELMGLAGPAVPDLRD